jgi:amidophosphoribosyltransferase
MSDQIGHYCGLALVRLRQPLGYFRQRYGDPAWGLQRLYLLMEKQHNRGQDGAGLAVAKFDMPPGEPYLRRVRSDRHNAIERVFDVVMKDVRRLRRKTRREASDARLKRRCEFLGEVLLGHLRYGTHSSYGLANCHPLLRRHSVSSRSLALAGNFNMTNSDELFRRLVADGLSPVGESDTQVIIERIGSFLDREHHHLVATMGPESLQGLEGRALAETISRELDLRKILARASAEWDGGWVFVGMLGNGDAFACRDPAGIRPGFFLVNEEVVAVASERAALANVFDVDPAEVRPIEPGHALTIKRDGRIEHLPYAAAVEVRQCTFERIYFSRGNDPEIYRQRKALGRNLAQRVLAAIDEDPEHTVFSYIPNTAEAAYVGLLEELDHLVRARMGRRLQERLARGPIGTAELNSLLNCRIRTEKIAHKDQRLRTFITHDAARRNLVLHIYDITRGVIGPRDTLVVIDDSIVRGTTLRESIITILGRLRPRRILVVSSAPPILYPDCYGIDMSQLGRFIGFEAAVSLLQARGEQRLIEEVAERCRAEASGSAVAPVNHVEAIYQRLTLDEISAEVARLVRPRTLDPGLRVDVLYQSIDGLRSAMGEFTGDWYFTGRYPTPGGYRVLNRSFLNWYDHNDSRRAYEEGTAPAPPRQRPPTLWAPEDDAPRPVEPVARREAAPHRVAASARDRMILAGLAEESENRALRSTAPLPPPIS